MKRVLGIILAALLLPLSVLAAENRQDPAPRLDLYWESLSPDAWRNFFMVDAVMQRLPAGAVQVKHHVLVSKGKDGRWVSRKGDLELKEAARLAVMLPNPRKYEKSFGPRLAAHAARIQGRMQNAELP